MNFLRGTETDREREGLYNFGHNQDDLSPAQEAARDVEEVSESVRENFARKIAELSE